MTEPKAPQADNAITHGMYAVDERGHNALEPAEIERLKDLKALLAEQPGRLDVRAELAARVAVIVEMGFVYMQNLPADYPIWEKGPLKALGTYIALLQRLLDNWPDQENKPINVTEILRNDG